MVRSIFYNQPDSFLIAIKHPKDKSADNEIKFGNDVMDISYNKADGSNIKINVHDPYYKSFDRSLTFNSEDSYFNKSCHVTQFDDWPEYDVMQIPAQCNWL
ncbi:MAG: hypothetical protein HRK26_02440 [Rickettsiaceae bacterium H1]|nr:hypothetical protein [Rickettsiaceae bacterium H1]